MKSWNVYKSIDNLEGQALTKINIGEVLDSSGDWAGALEAFEEGYRMAVRSNLPSVQMSALNNMHYSHMIRFDNIEEARKLQHDIQELKHILDKEDILRNLGNDYCSETETEGDDVSYNVPSSHNSLDITNPKLVTNVENYEDDVPLSSLFCRSKNLSKIKTSQLNPHEKETSESCNLAGDFSGGLRRFDDNQQPVGRKRSRVVISDDEADEMNQPCKEPHRSLIEDMTTNRDNMHEEATGTNKLQDVSLPGTSRDVLSASMPVCNEESICSFRSKSPKFTSDIGMEFGSSSNSGIASAFKVAENGSKMDSGRKSESLLQNQNGAGLKLAEDGHHSIMFKIGHDFIRLNMSSWIEGDNLTIEHVKIEVACVYYLQFSEEKRSKAAEATPSHQKSNVDEVASAENVDCTGLEVADSEDEAGKERTDASCASSCRRSRFAGSELVRDVSAAIGLATRLQLVDLSRNGLSLEAAEELYSAWSRCGRKHIKKDGIVYFSVEGKGCCGVKPCCRRD